MSSSVPGEAQARPANRRSSRGRQRGRGDTATSQDAGNPGPAAVTLETAYERLGGYAATPEAHRLGITSLRSDPHRPDAPPSCAFTWWQPPHRLALTPAICRRLVKLAERGIRRDDVIREPWRAMAYALPADLLGGQLAQQVIEPLQVANELWWRLQVGSFHVELKRYEAGHSHREHADLDPGSMGRKLAMSVQLSAPGTYAGGDLQIRIGSSWITAPRELGTVMAFPAWAHHRVTPVTEGIRWSLIVTGVGDPIR